MEYIGARVVEPDPAWKAGGTTLQGYSTQQFMTAQPINVDHSKKVELVLRLVARYYRIIIRDVNFQNFHLQMHTLKCNLVET